MAMDDQAQKAFDFAAELAKQLITLATGVIALSATFLTDIMGYKGTGSGGTPPGFGVLIAGWGLLFLSVVGGVAVLMALTGELEPLQAGSRKPSTRGPNVVRPAIFQIVTFLAGLALLIAFGARSVMR